MLDDQPASVVAPPPKQTLYPAHRGRGVVGAMVDLDSGVGRWRVRWALKGPQPFRAHPPGPR